MSPAAFSIRNRALVNAAMILVLVVGIFAYIQIPRELNPKVSSLFMMSCTALQFRLSINCHQRRLAH